MLNKLFERGANVIYGAMEKVHVSGHGSRDELRTMIETVRPKLPDPGARRSPPPASARQLAEAAGMNRRTTSSS